MRNLSDFHFGRGVKVYRGLNDTTPEQLDTSDIGPHWSKNKTSAEDWVTGISRDNNGVPEAQIGVRNNGLLLEGRVNKKHTSTPTTFEREKETTIAKGATVRLRKIHTVRVDRPAEGVDDFNKGTVVRTKRVFKKATVGKGNSNDGQIIRRFPSDTKYPTKK